MSADYRESVIIPLAMWEKCNFRENVTVPTVQKPLGEDHELLYSRDIPSDLKMKLYSQQAKLRSPKTKYPKFEMVKPAVETKHELGQDINSILQHFSSKSTPNASSILSKILQNKENIKWNDKLEVIVHGVHYPASNIIDLLHGVCLGRNSGHLER